MARRPDNRIYYAHSPNPTGQWQTMASHIDEHSPEGSRVGVAAGTQAFAEPFSDGARAYLAGLLHDLGKYSDSFQKRLEGEGKGLDHWSAGAWVALNDYRSIDAALAIQGHHIGLQRGDKASLKAMRLASLAENHPLGLRLTEADPAVLLERLAADGFTLPPKGENPLRPSSSAAAMLDVRMLFSALVDADFLDTERHMQEGDNQRVRRPLPPPLDAARALRRLEAELDRLNADVRTPLKTRQLRRTLADACADAGASTGQLFTLTAPTGAGKTLAMLRFALTRAAQDPTIRRILVVLPFLTVLDQTVQVYRKLFAPFGEHYLLEHHSLTGTREEAPQAGDEQANSEREARLLTQNWDSPVIVTTSVQFLESLFANRPGACRKLHHLAGSVILFDEVQTLPLHLAVPTLKTLARLADGPYAAAIVFATATQPAFEHLSAAVREGEDDPGRANRGWQPREIVPKALHLFSQIKRVIADWSHAQVPLPLTHVADWLRAERQALCIVNIKPHAREVAKLLIEGGVDGVYHLSTALCPAHRRALLHRMTAALERNAECRLVATQCVEAGVDLDFPRAFRALGPLEAIAQAGGRCNRSGRSETPGILTVFLPEDERYPRSGVYKKAAALTKVLLNEKGDLDINNPALFSEYFRRLYSLSTINDQELADAILRQDYVEVARLYRLIDENVVNVVVPYSARALRLMDEARAHGITRAWVRQARAYSVSLYRPRDGRLPTFLEPIVTQITAKPVADWYLCPVEAFYDDVFGLLPDESAGSGCYTV